MALVSRPEDRPKVVILSVLIVAFLAYFALVVLPQLRGGSKPAQTASTAPTTSAPPAATTPTATAAAPVAAPSADAAQALAQLDDPGGPIPPPARDPFRPPVVRAAPGPIIAGNTG